MLPNLRDLVERIMTGKIENAGKGTGAIRHVPHALDLQYSKLSLDRDMQPKESLANYRWVGAVPPELQDLM
jgi:hypothetical protein